MSHAQHCRLMAEACRARAVSDGIHAVAYRVCPYLTPAEKLDRELAYLNCAARERSSADEWDRMAADLEAQA